MASLETLPAPLPLYIAKLLPDLKALDAIRRSSPWFAATFALHAAELLEHVMQNTLLIDVIIEIRAYVLLLVEQQTPQNADDLVSLYARAQQVLPPAASSIAISRVLRRFTSSHSLVQAIFQTKLSDFYSLPHEHLEDRSASYLTDGSPSGNEAGYFYHLRDATPAYWLEEQRLFRGVWRVYLCRALGNPDYFHALRYQEDDRANWQADEIEDVLESIALLRDTNLSTSQAGSTSWKALAPVPVPSASADEETVNWQLDLEASIRAAQSRPLGHGYFHGPCLRYRYSPLQKADWRVFRRLGLGLWADRRMKIEFELVSWPLAFKPPPDSPEYSTFKLVPSFSTSQAFFTWKALYQAATSRWGWEDLT